jgi:predicted metal-binding protein
MMNRDWEYWIERALYLNVHKAKAIPVDSIIVAEWVRLKCQFGCGGYGERLTCPPFSPTPEATRAMLKAYSQALLLSVEGKGQGVAERKIRRILNKSAVALEREIFLRDYSRAWAMTSGPCTLCKECDTSQLCIKPEQARPSMEACGIDVFTTVRNAGWEIEVVKTFDSPFRLFALVLIE